MKNLSCIFFCVLLGVITPSVARQQSSKHPITSTGIAGQVYAVGAPAVRIDWTPPPLERVSTIVITDTTGKEINYSLDGDVVRHRE